MRRIVFIILMVFVGGVSANAQRPVGDTINLGNGGYLYDSMYDTGAYAPFMYDSLEPDCVYGHYWTWYLYLTLRGQMSFEDFIQQYPDLATRHSGRHVMGQEFSTSETMVVIGLAVCPTIYFDVTHSLLATPFASLVGPYLHVKDTAMATREDEYVQLYTIEGGQPQLQAEGKWRWEYPHRYMLFPRFYDWNGAYNINIFDDTTYVPLYEVMFDTGILIGGKNIMLAGTHNNNSTVWSLEAVDTVFTEPKICWEHYPTEYSSTACGYSSTCWVRRDTTFPWYSSTGPIGGAGLAINIFPILDTLFGTPCAAVTGLDTAEVDSVQATLMWSADARHHGWEVWYRPTVDSIDSSTVLTTSVPTVTLTGLMPGVEYSVAVRGLCDIENYSPWCDTLLFTTQIIDTNTIDTTQTQGIRWLGNLDRFTRIMPNPAHDVVNVLSSYRLESVAVYDLTGRQLLEQPADGISTVVDVSALPRGTYIMAIRTQQGVATKKLLVER